MALKADRNVVETTGRFKAGSMAMAAGGVLSVDTAASGLNTTVSYATNPSGAKPIGVLLSPVANYDWDTDIKPLEKEVYAYADQIPILVIGTVLTNMVTGSPSVGDTAYLAASGYITPTQATGAPEIGQFVSMADADSYYHIDIRC